MYTSSPDEEKRLERFRPTRNEKISLNILLSDPNFDTEENEYRDEYYERIAYANSALPLEFPMENRSRPHIYSMGQLIQNRPAGGSRPT